MSIARHHAEWLTLTDIVGPFLSMEVLLEVFPQGLDVHDAEKYQLLKQAYEEWTESQHDGAIHRVWVEWVLQNTLGYPGDYLRQGQEIPASCRLTLSQHQVTLCPDWVLVDPDTEKPLLLIQIVPPTQKLEGTMKNAAWAASPASQMIELLRGTDRRLGLLTNGEQWMLVHAPSQGSSTTVSWYGNVWVEEKLTVRSFRSLLGIQRFLGVDEAQTLIPLFERSKDSQQEVTDQLGFQVRKAVEILIQKFDQLNGDLNGELLQGRSPSELYQAACFVMMRLVFLLCAEERELLLQSGIDQTRYDQNYAVSTLQRELREFADKFGEEILERNYDAWCRLLALFRAVHGGAYHDLLAIPARGGDLFDPDKFPFLEGRFGTRQKPIQVDNRTVLHLLESLQILQFKVPGGGVEPRRLSFKTIEVEQIGHVYEGLLDHQAIRAEATVLGLVGTKNKEPEIALEVLEDLAAAGEEALLTFLKKETGRSVAAFQKVLGAEMNLSHYEESRYLVKCGSNPELWRRIKPFYQLIRLDTYGYPVIIPAGGVFVTTGTSRRESGTHYTPKHLAQEIVQHTLEPLVYEGMSEGLPPEPGRLLSPQGLLALKICDPTMGSGAFLVQVCRFLAARLVESWGALEEKQGGKVLTVFGNLSKPELEERTLPSTPEERLLEAKRLIAERCLYGVDKNPLAVEMAKLSLWLETLQKDRPFTFVDHALRCGDSLVGATVAQLKYWSLDTSGQSYQLGIGADEVQRLIKEATAKRLELESFTVVSPADQARKGLLLTEAEARLKDLRDRADLLVSSYLAEVKKSEREDLRNYLLMVANGKADMGDYQRRDLPDLDLLRPFHWELEFPEVFLEGAGFDAIVGNPPFQGGKKITGTLGTPYRDFIQEFIGNNVKGNADLVAYFFLQVCRLLRAKGHFGLVATNTIAQGDTREVGLDQIATQGSIYRAVPSRPWSGTAALEVAYVWGKKGQWQGKYYLDEKAVNGITPYLTVPGTASGKPERLEANSGKSFIGSYVLGMGFVLEPQEAQTLIAKNPKNKDVLFPYLNGSDLNSNPDQAPSRWIINFFDWPLSPEQDDPKKPKGAPYASDYPDCLDIVERLVKPERTRLNDKDEFVLRKPLPQKWWIYADKRPALYEAITDLSKNSNGDEEGDRVLVAGQTSKYLSLSFYKPDIIFSHMTIVFTLNRYWQFSILNNSFHWDWVCKYCSSMREWKRYFPTDGFETFPFPDLTPPQEQTLNDIGKRYYEHRQAIMTATQLGLTKTYNCFHDRAETDPDIGKLRQLHIEMDQAVCAAYGWQDLLTGEGLNHDFHDTKQGQRFTISETIRREILDRLLQLNHQRYAEEVAQGLHNKKGKKKASKPQKSVPNNPGQLGLNFTPYS